MQKLNWKVLLMVGLAAGTIQALAGVVMYVAGVYFAAWSMLVSVLVLILCIILGTRWYRNNTIGGTITYSQALIVGITISVSTGIIYALYNVISISFLYPHFLDEMIGVSVARMQASGLGSEQATELIASVKQNTTLPKIALGNLVRLSIIGSFFSTITSIFLRRKDLSGVHKN
jgi:uncharacterized protein YebE (UPF0316 family)